MKKILLVLSALLVLGSCSQTKKWTDKERNEVKEVVRSHKEKTLIKNMEDNYFDNLETCVVTTIEGTYPDYNAYNKLTGKTDTVVGVLIDCTAQMLGANYENLPVVFPAKGLQAAGIIPQNATPEQLTAFYTCFTGKVKAAYPQSTTFAQAMSLDPGMSDEIIMMLQNCAEQTFGAPNVDDPATKLQIKMAPAAQQATTPAPAAKSK